MNQQSKHSTSDNLLCFFSNDKLTHVDVDSSRIFLAVNEEMKISKFSSSAMACFTPQRNGVTNL